jgi:hypothetical protein
MAMSIRSYARARSADEQSVRRAVRDGVIALDAEGRVDPTQADASWGLIRRGSRLGARQIDDAGVRSARAKIAVAIAKFRFVKDRYDAAADRYIDRAQFSEVAASEADYVLDALRAAPAIHAAAFAVELAIDPMVAREILTEFIQLALGEIGDIRQQAIADAKRA